MSSWRAGNIYLAHSSKSKKQRIRKIDRRWKCTPNGMIRRANQNTSHAHITGGKHKYQHLEHNGRGIGRRRDATTEKEEIGS